MGGMSKGSPIRVYWKFYWPLTIMGLAMLLSNQFQNGVLARYPEAVRELTTFALAGSFFGFLHAALVFLPQMTNVYGRSPAGASACFHFACRAGLGLSLPLLVLGWTPSGIDLSTMIFGVDVAVAATMQIYFRLLAPVIFMDAMRHAFTGLLIQTRRTGWVTVLNIAYLSVVLLVLMLGFHFGLSGVWTVGLAQLAGALFALLGSWFAWSRFASLLEGKVEPPSQGELFNYFWPVALTSICFALSRPIIFLFASRTAEAFVLIAALRVSFDFAMLFFNPVNQFRHLLVTFGMDDRKDILGFLVLVVTGLSGALVVIALSPMGSLIFRTVFGLEGKALEFATAALLPLALVPLAMGLRNWLHGYALVGRATRRMSTSALARIGVISLAAWGLVAIGWFGPRAAASLLAFGFLAEAGSMWVLARWFPIRKVA